MRNLTFLFLKSQVKYFSYLPTLERLGLTGEKILIKVYPKTRGFFLNSLFTSTSVVCVTGLVVVDIGKDLSIVGQLVTLFLIQIGGLGIITFSTIFLALMGRGISFKENEIVQSSFLHTPRRDFVTILKSILWFSFGFESLGMIILFFRFSRDYSLCGAFYKALFYSISAFNNAGCSLFSDSFIGYQEDLVINLTVMGLIVFGGIGFLVKYEILSYLRGIQKKLSIHTKIVIITTAILIISGSILFYLFERNHMIKDIPILTKILVSLFQSVTPRTAGFNTIEISTLTNTTVLLLLILMFIGTSPGSTGGEVKTTICELVPPQQFIGKTIGELHLRSHYHMEVFAIREVLPERIQRIPKAEFVIKDSDI